MKRDPINVTKFESQIILTTNHQINRCQQYRYLGVILDKCLTMRQNYNSIFKKFSYKIYQFSKIKKFLNTETRF